MGRMESHINSSKSIIDHFHDACGVGFIAESTDILSDGGFAE